MAIRSGLLREVVVMAYDTVRSNKMRSGLTVLGVVIGITSIVGMTALIRGFDQSLREMIRTIGPDTIFIQRFGVTSFANGVEFKELLKRPTLTVSDARAIEEQAGTIGIVDIELGAGGPPTQQRVFGLNPVRVARNAAIVPIQLAVVPREGVTQQQAIADIERVMRIRHGLRLDQPNDFDIVTQDAFLQLWDRVSQATFFAL